MTYEDVAGMAGLRFCGGCQYGDHTAGYRIRGTVHYKERRMTRRILYRYCVLLGGAYVPTTATEWETIYQASRWAYHFGLTRLHRRFPRWYSEQDRARVLYLTRNIKGLAREIYEWSHQSIRENREDE